MENFTESKINELKLKANEIRKSIISMLVEAGSGHTAGPLDMTDIFTYLYFYGLKHDPKNPKWEERDRLVLSNGHICPVLYATLAHAGYLSLEELKTLRKFGSRLQGHPHRDFLPILETSSGPLGEGLSQAIGMALALKIDKGITSDQTIYCLLGDGELDEGQNWEALMLGAKEKLANITAIIDRNNIQIDGTTNDVMPLENLKSKLESFNWHVEEINGHNFKEIHEAIRRAKNNINKPSIIIANTIPSKGIKEWEGNYKWHGKVPNRQEAENAIDELNKKYA